LEWVKWAIWWDEVDSKAAEEFVEWVVKEVE
jgi:hypothetical protein